VDDAELVGGADAVVAPPLIYMLSAYAVELTGLEGRESVEYCRIKRPEVQHAVGGRTDKQYGDGHNGQILLELEAPVHCDQRVVLTFHAAKKLAVRDARPPAAGHGIDSVALECRCEV
jgi:hypothetical protein